jgi:hypothetical protein
MSEIITDAGGREIEVVVRTTLERRRFIRAMGAASDIDRWIGEAMIAMHARTVGGVPVVVPTSPDAADVLVDKLGPDGLTAVGMWLAAKQGMDVAGAEAAAKN